VEGRHVVYFFEGEDDLGKVIEALGFVHGTTFLENFFEIVALLTSLDKFERRTDIPLRLKHISHSDNVRVWHSQQKPSLIVNILDIRCSHLLRNLKEFDNSFFFIRAALDVLQVLLFLDLTEFFVPVAFSGLDFVPLGVK